MDPFHVGTSLETKIATFDVRENWQRKLPFQTIWVKFKNNDFSYYMVSSTFQKTHENLVKCNVEYVTYEV